MGKKKLQRFLPGVLLLFFVGLQGTGCRLDYSKTVLTEEMQDSIPETILMNISQTRVRNGQISSIIKADKIETFKNKNIMQIENMYYREINKTGETLTEGWADNSLFYTDTEDAEIFGDVHFYSLTEEAGIYARTLNWNSEKKILEAPEDELVTITREDGSYVQGTGFRTDLRLKEMTFSGPVHGMYVDETEDEESTD